VITNARGLAPTCYMSNVKYRMLNVSIYWSVDTLLYWTFYIIRILLNMKI